MDPIVIAPDVQLGRDWLSEVAPAAAVEALRRLPPTPKGATGVDVTLTVPGHVADVVTPQLTASLERRLASQRKLALPRAIGVEWRTTDDDSGRCEARARWRAPTATTSGHETLLDDRAGTVRDASEVRPFPAGRYALQVTESRDGEAAVLTAVLWAPVLRIGRSKGALRPMRLSRDGEDELALPIANRAVSGLALEFSWAPHQSRAAWRVTNIGRNTVCVGAARRALAPQQRLWEPDDRLVVDETVLITHRAGDTITEVRMVEVV